MLVVFVQKKMESQLQEQHLKLWVDRQPKSDKATDASFPRFCELVDNAGDALDDWGTSLPTELKAIGLWGGSSALKPVMMAYNDLKSADSIMRSLDGFSQRSEVCVSVAHLIAINRQTLVRNGELDNPLPVFESERHEAAKQQYMSSAESFIKHPPKRALDKILNPPSEHDAHKKIRLEESLKKEIRSTCFDKNGQLACKFHPDCACECKVFKLVNHVFTSQEWV